MVLVSDKPTNLIDLLEDVSNLWICSPLGVREHHQRA
jgi:hypothetical protein